MELKANEEEKGTDSKAVPLKEGKESNKPKQKASNDTHYSLSDPDAKMSVKPHKPLRMNYLGMMKVRQSTVEPVIGTLVNYTGIGRVYTHGLALANKCITLAAIAYNLKKMVKKQGKSSSKQVCRTLWVG